MTKMEVGKKYVGLHTKQSSKPVECIYVSPGGSALIINEHRKEFLLYPVEQGFWKEVIEPRKSNMKYVGVYICKKHGFILSDDIFNHRMDVRPYFGNSPLVDTLDIQYVEKEKNNG